MMKSFFKKLSLVMALAMVVSMVTPAANAFAAEAGITLQGSKTVITETINMELGGADVDFAFEGAPKDWKTTYKWTSSDETIAKVNTAGVVTALKAGEATITLTAGADGSYKHSVKVVITEPVDVNAFEAKQKSHITFDVNFNKEVSYSKPEEVYLYRVFNTEDGDVYAVWAVRNVTLSDDKKTLTVEPYVQFGDGERYLVAFQDLESQLDKGDDLKGIPHDFFTTYIGEIDDVKLSWASYDEDGIKLGSKAYTNGEDAEYDVEVKLSYKLYSGEVDLTEIYKNDGYLEYTLINEDSVADYVVLSDDTLVFTKENIPALVKATYTFEKEDGEEGKATSDDYTIISTLLDPLTINYVEKWSFVDKDGKVDWSKVDHDVRAGKTAQIALLLKDNRGGQWETTTVANDTKIAQFGTGDTEGMSLHFYSTDNDHFLISDVEDTFLGEIETYIKMKKAVVYVALHDEKLLEEYEDDFVANIGACVVNITDPAQLDDTVVYAADGKTVKSSVTKVTDAVEDSLQGERFIPEFTEETLIVKLLDQDKAVYNWNLDPVLTGTNVEFKLSTTNKDLRETFEANNGEGTEGLQIVDNGDGTADLMVDAMALNDQTTSSTITVTITATQYDESGEKIDSAKTTFKVYLRDPELYDTEDTDLNGWEVGDVKTTSWGLSTANVGLMTTKGVSSTEVLMTMLSKSYPVGYYNRYDMANGSAIGEGITIATSEDEYTFKKGSDFATAPGIYVLVTGPDGIVLQTTTPGALGVEVRDALAAGQNSSVVVNVTGDSDGDGIVEYMKTGKYTVKVTFVTDVEVDGETGKVDTITYKTRNSSFTVTNDIDNVQFIKMNEVTTPLELDPENVDMATVKTIIQENYKFKYDLDNDGDMDDWTPSDAEIDDVKYIVRGGYITIKSITFKIATGNNYYLTTTRDINKAVKLGVEE